MDKIKVLFVCLGNICRSPMAEGLFIHKIKERGIEDLFEVDSAGTSGWHVGEPADRRMSMTAKSHGVHLPSRSRQLLEEDFEKYDYILGMDESNMKNIQKLHDQNPAPAYKAEILKMRKFDSEARFANVPDPYYGTDDGFEDVYQMLDRSTEEFLDFVLKEKSQA